MLQWAMRKMEIEKWIVRRVLLILEGASTQVRANGDASDKFSVEVYQHHYCLRKRISDTFIWTPTTSVPAVCTSGKSVIKCWRALFDCVDRP